MIWHLLGYETGVLEPKNNGLETLPRSKGHKSTAETLGPQRVDGGGGEQRISITEGGEP
jgi:hypothetical protein